MFYDSIDNAQSDVKTSLRQTEMCVHIKIILISHQNPGAAEVGRDRAGRRPNGEGARRGYLSCG